MKRLLTKYLEFVIKQPYLIAIAFILLTGAVAAWLIVAKPLGLDTSFLSLLPDDMPYVVASKQTSERIGSTDMLVVVVQSPNPADNMAFIDEVASKIAKLEETKWMAVEEDKSYFRDRRLLYLDKVDLEQIVARAKARLDFEKKIRNPFYISLDDEKAPDIGFDDILGKYEERFKNKGAKGIVQDKKVGLAQSVDIGDRLSSDDGTIMTVVARLSKPSLDMTFTKSIIKKVQRIIDESNPNRNPEMQAEIASSYRNRSRVYNAIIDDIFSSLGISLGLILLVIAIFFRRFRAIGLIFIPLTSGMFITAGLTAATIGRLNMTTALIFAVLLGLGIDFGVHLTLRYLDERARGKSLFESLQLAMINTGKAIILTGLTTALGLAVLLLAEFKGFWEFGAIAMMAIGVCMVVYLLFLPALAVLFEKASVPKPWRKYKDQGAVVIKPVTVSPSLIRTALFGVTVLTLLGAAAVFFVSFEYDFHKLQAKKGSASINYGKAIGGRSSPVVAIMPSQEDAEQLTRELTDVIDKEQKKSQLKRVLSLFTFVPEDQEQKLPLLNRLEEHVNEALSLDSLKPKTKDRLEEILAWTHATPVTVDQLPPWLKTKFEEKDGTLGRIAYLMPRIDEYIITEMEQFYNRYGTIQLSEDKEPVHLSASGFVLVEVVRAVKRDGRLMTLAAAFVIFLVLLVDLRSFREALVVFIPLLVGLLWCAGLMVLLNIKIGLYNMLVLPTLLGIGIDSAIHLYHSYKEHGPGSLGHVMRTTGTGIVVAAATTGMGFVGMTIVSHQGLRTIGHLAVAGTTACLLGTMICLPLFLLLKESIAAKRSFLESADEEESTAPLVQ